MTDSPKPDPGNAPPEEWTEEIDPEETAEIRSLLGVDKEDD